MILAVIFLMVIFLVILLWLVTGIMARKRHSQTEDASENDKPQRHGKAGTI